MTSNFSERFGKELSKYREDLPTFIKSITVAGEDDDDQKIKQKNGENTTHSDDDNSDADNSSSTSSSSSSDDSDIDPDTLLNKGLFSSGYKTISTDNDNNNKKNNNKNDIISKNDSDDEPPTHDDLPTRAKNRDSFLTFHLKFCRPFDVVHVHFEEKFRTHYPNGSVTFSISSSTTLNHQDENNNNSTIVRCLPAASKPTFHRITEAIEAMARAAGADAQAYERKTGIQTERDKNSNNKNNRTNMKPSGDFSVGPSIEELFPLHSSNTTNDNTQKHANVLTPEQEEDMEYAAQSNNFIRQKSSSSSLSLVNNTTSSRSATSMMFSNHQTRNKQQQQQQRTLSFADGNENSFRQWSVAMTCEDDVAIDALQSNEQLLRDIQRIEQMLDGGHHMGRNQISNSVFSTIQSLDAGLIRFSFSFSAVELCEDIMRKYIAQNVYRSGASSSSSSSSSSKDNMTAAAECFLHQYHASCTIKSIFTLLQSLQMEKSERFIFNFIVDPVQYPRGLCKVDFGQSGNFANGVFPGAVGQLRRLLQSYILTEQRIVGGEVENDEVANAMRNGYSEDELLIALKKHEGNVALALEELEKEYSGGGGNSSDAAKSSSNNKKSSSPHPSSSSSWASDLPTTQKLKFRKQHPPPDLGIFVGCVVVLINRLPTLPDECCICARPHLFSLGGGSNNMCGVSVCTRPTCVFRFSKLDVAKDVASTSALQSGVIDLLIVLTRAAAFSERWKLIFIPFPTLIDPETGKIMCSPENKDIKLCRDILENFPLMKRLATSDNQHAIQETLSKHHRLAMAMFNSIVSDMRAVLVKLPAELNIDFMKCKHQFRLILQSPEREERFQELKKQHGSKYCFHGSDKVNWRAVLATGLKNCSGTALQTSGAAYNAGIYLSPYSGLSSSYSNFEGYWSMDSTQIKRLEDNHFQEEFIEPGAAKEEDEHEDNRMRVIAICEVIPHELRYHHDIWVQPNEDHVVTRFLFVYTRSTCVPEEINLYSEDNATPKKEYTSVLDKVLEQTC